MSFTDRMGADVGARQPRRLYLARKLLEVLGIAFGVWLLLGAPASHQRGDAVLLLLVAGIVHPLISAALWWSTHPIDWWGDRGRGGVFGDLLYHGWIALTPFAAMLGIVVGGRLGALAVFALMLAGWWVLEGMGFGVVRSGA